MTEADISALVVTFEFQLNLIIKLLVVYLYAYINPIDTMAGIIILAKQGLHLKAKLCL